MVSKNVEGNIFLRISFFKNLVSFSSSRPKYGLSSSVEVLEIPRVIKVPVRDETWLTRVLRVGGSRLLCHDWRSTGCTMFSEGNMAVSIKIKIVCTLWYSSSISALEKHAHKRGKSWTKMFVVALFTSVKHCKQMKYLSVGKWLKKLWYNHTHRGIPWSYKK